MESKLVFDMFEEGRTSSSVNVHIQTGSEKVLIGTYDLKEFMLTINQGSHQVMFRDEVESISIELESKEYEDDKSAA